ncbi:MAG: ABC transporter ATP-binding protein/permease [Bacteroidetes bacterium]|nr:ABC transporter ATP-binding protein/permease [Bacteroidota bacterium]
MAALFHEDEPSGKALDIGLMKRLVRYVLPHKKLVFWGVLLSVASSFLGPLRPYLSHIAIDDYIAKGDWNGLHFIGLTILVILLFEILFQFGLTYITQYLGQKAIFDLRLEIFSFLQRLNLTFFDKNPLGRLISRVTSDVEVLNEMFSSGLVAIFGDLFRLCFILLLMFLTDWRLSLITLSVLPFMIYGSFLFRRKARESYLEVRVQVAKLMSFLQEHISGMSIVQIFNREERELRKFKKINTEHRDAHIRGIYYYSVFYPAVDFLSALAVALIVWYGGGEVVQSNLTIGVLFMFIQYVEQFFRPIRDLSEKYDIMQRAMASSDRIFTLLDRAPYVEKNEGVLKVDKLQGAVEFDHVWSAYQDEEWILKGVSFSVKPGEKVALVGATGSGKTTIISLLTRFYPYQKGTIRIDGHDINEFELSAFRSRIGVVLQDVFLFTGTVYENLTLGRRDIPLEKVKEAARLVQADSFISKLPGEYNFLLSERGGNLSVGQRQLISFVRVLLFNPDIVILDEATSSVDTETEFLIQKAVELVMKDRTAIVIAHRLSTIHKSDKIIVLHKGEVKETGSHQQLMNKNGIYRKLYQLQYKEQEITG